MSSVNVPTIDTHVLPFHFLPHLRPTGQPRPQPTTSPLFAFSFSSYNDVMMYREELRIASDASVNFLLAFFVMMNSLRDNARKKAESRRAGHRNSPARVRLLFSCQFELGWCPGWDQSDTDHLDWAIHRGPVGTTGTGPVIDHTRLDANGSYAYMDASDGGVGNIAIFRTPFVSMNSHEEYCFRFWYLMYGEGMGSLRVFWIPRKQAGSSSPVFLVGSKEGQQSEDGKDWKEMVVTMTSPTYFGFTSEVYFEFQATKGYLPTSNIAVDDISLYPGPCPAAPEKQTLGIGPRVQSSSSGHVPSSDADGREPPHRCGESTYNPDMFICCNGRLNSRNVNATQQCCGSSLFVPGKAACCGSTIVSGALAGCCGGRTYNRIVRSCCSGKTFSPAVSDCVNGVIGRREG